MRRPADLFIFAGAGASRAMPAGLPMFNAIRSDVLSQLRLGRYAETSARSRGVHSVGGTIDVAEDPASVAAAMFPEPFLHELSQARINVDQWLGDVLGSGSPNAVHQQIGRLAQAGACVWTVNFDHLIESSVNPTLPVDAWPTAPTAEARIRKPHGTLGARLIATSGQVLAGLDPIWLARLQDDLRGRSTVVFIGYSGRDLDFHPHWDDVLKDIDEIIWFDLSDPETVAFKTELLPDATQRGALHLPNPSPLPDWAPQDAAVSPSWDFLSWCREEGLGQPEDSLTRQLFKHLSAPPSTPLEGDLTWARPAVLGLLGDYRHERREYLKQLLRPHGDRRRALSSLASFAANHGGKPTGAALNVLANTLPANDRWSGRKELARRKHLTVLNRVGAHQKTLGVMTTLDIQPVSTYGILRAQALRMTASLDEAAEVADAAYKRALIEKHAVRIAHAAYQKCQALVWAERTEEAEHSLREELRPHAAIATSRWVAWADFIDAELAVRRDPATDNAKDAVTLTRTSERRFLAEALLDGAVSAQLVRLTAFRRAADLTRFDALLQQVQSTIRAGRRHQRYYTARHAFTIEAVNLDLAEIARTHRQDHETAISLYRRLSNSRYPIHSTLGYLGLAMIDYTKGIPSTHLDEARTRSTQIGLRMATARCDALIGHDDGAAEIFFC